MNGVWLTEKQAIDILQMREHTKHPEKVLRRYCRQGRIEYGKCGDHYRFKQEWLDAFVMLSGSKGARDEANRKLRREIAAA